ncbi:MULTISPECIES: FxsA family protein [Prauserella salsuginis group]|uniref:UPF0716 protein FxsA n=2 Tax=Prauserella salsuginis group TaxID=2893672 RepID=A0A839XPS2_9PSEU|nr:MULTISPECIES: FxsA family protein [Prauserella salsuginis group]MBB3662848.1 UPF0716 protein FxsA [Prauserella sediminis]MCR3720545.1 UPF0716 protein FxsA [Prauserella flava]MCR3733745.1 UPF0716 protein FxsA [Prauserella salsuginis]
MAVLLLLYVIAEVAAVWTVASFIGFLPTIGLLIAGAFVGSWLARREGGKAMRAFSATARSGKSPHEEITDGMLVGVGGMLILLPGFVSDVLGLLFLIPPTRKVVRRSWLRRAQKRAPAGGAAYGGGPFGPGMRSQVIVVDSEVVADGEDTGDTSRERDRSGDDRDDGPPRIIEG